MLEITHETKAVVGGVDLGSGLIAVVAGLVSGGPIGAGFAASTVVAAQGIDNLYTLLKTKEVKREGEDN